LKNLLTYLPMCSFNYLPIYLYTYLHTYYPPTYLPIYINQKINLKKCHVIYFDDTNWQILITLGGNMWMDYILITKMSISSKLHMNAKWMKPYMSTIYIIHMKCVDVMANHHLQFNIECNFIYVSNGFLIACVDYDFSIFTSYSHKWIFFF